MSFRDKIVSVEQLARWRRAARQAGRRVVATNGCFDLLHAGHVTYLEAARAQGDLLVVGLNGNRSVRALKGKGRPLNSQTDRAAVVAALESVSRVVIFQEKRARRFLERVQPDVYVKGGDYTLETLDSAERQTVERTGGRIVILPFVPGKSTTRLLNKLAKR